MSRSRKSKTVRVRGERRTPTDIRKLSRALMLLAQAQSEADAESQHRRQHTRKPLASDDRAGAA